MRVIAGSARRLQLKTLDGLETRPTTDRIKETLFNMIWRDVVSRPFLDCFAGSGGIGIEALSRGASEAVFIEKNPKAAACIRQNLKTTRLEAQGQAFGVIFMDPPYRQDWERRALSYLKDSALADAETLIIAEASLETDFSYAEETGFSVIRQKEYKTNKHVFLQRSTGQEQI